MSSTHTLVLWFVIHLPSLSSQEGVLSSVISLVMVSLDQSLAEYRHVQGSTVTLQCDPGYVSDVDMLTCEGTLMWSPDPGTVVCRPLTPPPPTTRECTVSILTLVTVECL